MSNPAAASMSINEALTRAHAQWGEGQAEQAERLCLRVLAAWPGQADALHLLGVMAHAHGNLDLAITHVRQACKAPRASAVYLSNLAEMCRQKGLLVEGEEAGRRAVAMDSSLVSGWNNLGIVLQEAGKYEESRACLECVVTLQPDWAEAWNNLGNTCRRLGRFDLAQRHYRRALELNPESAEAHSNLAFLLSTQGHYDEAVQAARRAIDLNPRLVDAYLNLADGEMSRQRYGAALQALDTLRAFAPMHPMALLASSKALRQLDRQDDALVFARHAVALVPHSADAHYTLAMALQLLGQTDNALAAFERAIALPGTVTEEALIGRATLFMEAGRKDEALTAFDRALDACPGSIGAMAGRIEARRIEPGDPDIAALEAYVLEGGQRSLTDRIAVHFALGKAYLDTREPALAFAHLDEGNRRKRACFDYDSGATSQWMAHVAQCFAKERYAAFARAEEPSELPVFVIGMPRSGTTLIEQIVSSHRQVRGAGELSALRLAVEKSALFPERVATMTQADATRLGRDYLARVAPLADGCARLVDKMPGNFIHAGMIPLILPGARIIHARRNAVDTCLSCYTKLFGGEQRFAYSQTELGEFYGYYARLMDHWRAVLPPERFLEVDYEAVVEDLEGQARRMIAFLGLPWDEACLHFHDNRRVVRTASVNQVRQPIYTTSKGRWREHAAYLGPLLAALGEHAR